MGKQDPVDEGPSRAPRGFFEIYAASVPMVAITVVTISANGAILTMFLSRRALRRCKNLYFVSLALADFLVGLTMPFKLTQDLHFGWDTGWSCRFYQSFKQSLAYASFLSIFLIVLDRWRAVHYPVSYRIKSTKYTTIAAVIFVWIISFLIFTIPQLWWESFLSAKDADSKNEEVDYFPRNGLGLSSSARTSADSKTEDIYNLSSSLYVQFDKDTDRSLNKFHYCPEGYQFSFQLSVLSASLFYALPIAAMLFFDISLYLKIKWRKSVEVQRSTSVTDTYFMTLKKPALELSGSCRSLVGDDDAAKEMLLKNSDSKPINKHLALGSRGERRHSSLPAISPILKGRTSSGRRVSMPESNAGGCCRYVGRKWSGCASTIANNQNQPANPVANLAPRLHQEDMVHDLLVKQDKKTTLCLCLIVGILIICWLPHAAVSLINANCWCFFGTALPATSWLFQLDHALNPFLYGIMYVQFRNVLKQWLLIERVHAFKMRDTLILKNLQKKVEDEENNSQKSPNQQTKLSKFNVSQVTSQTDLTLDSSDNTFL